MKKPTPKPQKDISISQHDPYSKEAGNPNSIGEPNRSEQTSFRDDTTKPFKVGLQDIDESIMYYFQNVIKPFVIQNDTRIEVPVIYGSPEIWKSYQKDGYYRDLKGKIMAPLIMFKMESFDKDRSKGNKLDANNPNNFGVFVKKYSPKDSYSNFNILTNKVPEKIYYASVIPDYLDITYSCVVFTNYVEQLNKILEAIQYSSDSYWGDPEKFKFNAKIDSFNVITEINTGEDRVVKGNFNIKLKGYVVPEVLQKDLNFIKKFSDKSQVIFDVETTLDSPEQVSLGRRVNFIDSPIPLNNISSSGNSSGSGPFTIYARDSDGSSIIEVQVFPNPNNGQYIIEPFGLLNYLGNTIQSAYYPSQSLLDVVINSEDISGSISEWNIGEIVGTQVGGYSINTYIPRCAIRLSNGGIFDYSAGGDADYQLHSSSILYLNFNNNLQSAQYSTTASGDYLSPGVILNRFEVKQYNSTASYLTGDIFNNIITLSGSRVQNSNNSYSTTIADGQTGSIPNTYLSISGSNWTGSFPSGVTSSFSLTPINLTDSNGSGSVVQSGSWPGPIQLNKLIISKSEADNSTTIWDTANIIGISGSKYIIDKIIPRFQIRLTLGETFNFYPGGSTGTVLPNTTLFYFNKSNILLSASSFTTASGANLAYSGTIGRFEIWQFNGVTSYLTGDIFNRVITLLGSRVQNSGSTYFTTLADAQTGSIPNTYLINSGSSWTGSVASAVTSSIPNSYIISGSIFSGSFAAGITSSINFPLATYQLKDSGGNNISTGSIAGGTNRNITAPDATVKTTDGLTPVQVIFSNASGNLPQSTFKYKDENDIDAEISASNTLYSSSTLKPTTQAPRRELKNDVGTGLGLWATVGRLISDTIPAIPKVRISKSDGTTTDISYVATPSIIYTETDNTYVLYEYTSSGAFSKSSNTKGVWVGCGGAGGGGGGGRSVNTSGNAFGGGAGGGGAWVWKWIPATSLSASETITIGAGGTSGAGGSSGNGSNGGTGGTTSFGVHVIATGGAGGTGGSSATTVPTNTALSINCTPIYSPYALSGLNGTRDSDTVVAVVDVGIGGGVGARGGPGGGRLLAATAFTGSTGSGNTNGGSITAGGSGASTAGSAGTAGANDIKLDIMVLFAGTSITQTRGPGTGGGGGAYSSVGTGGAGGNGGRCGGAGGGGGSINTQTAGAGGVGGSGLCLVIEVLY